MTNTYGHRQTPTNTKEHRRTPTIIYCINQMCPLKEQCAPSHGSHGGEDYTTGLQGITFIKTKQMGDAEILEVQRLSQKLFVALVKGQLRSPEQ